MNTVPTVLMSETVESKRIKQTKIVVNISAQTNEIACGRLWIRARVSEKRLVFSKLFLLHTHTNVQFGIRGPRAILSFNNHQIRPFCREKYIFPSPWDGKTPSVVRRPAAADRDRRPMLACLTFTYLSCFAGILMSGFDRILFMVWNCVYFELETRKVL